MHARDLAELAALVAVESPALVTAGAQVPYSVIEPYWTASKCRLDRWGRLLRQLTAAAGQPPLPATLSWPRVRPVLEEILASELLTRLWTAAAAAYDAARNDQELSPVARNIFGGHLDARRRLLALLADGRVIQLPEAVKLNHLRRRVERATLLKTSIMNRPMPTPASRASSFSLRSAPRLPMVFPIARPTAISTVGSAPPFSARSATRPPTPPAWSNPSGSSASSAPPRTPKA
jgi:hypothetical protein